MKFSTQNYRSRPQIQKIKMFLIGRNLLLNLVLLCASISGCCQESQYTSIKGIKEIVQNDTLYHSKVFYGVRISKSSYNSDGLLISFEDDWQREGYPIKSRTLYQYENGKITAEIHYRKDSSIGERNYYYYDSCGRFVKNVSYMDDSTIRRVDSFVYSIAGKQRDRYTYFPTLYREYGPSSTEFLNDTGNPIKFLGYYDGEIDEINHITYNAKGDVVKKVNTNPKVKSKVTSEYVYNKFGDLVLVRTFSKNNKPTIEKNVRTKTKSPNLL